MIKTMLNSIVLGAVSCFVLNPCLFAQPPQSQPDMNIDAATRTAVIQNLFRELNDGYVFAEVAAKMEADVKSRVAAREYDNVASGRAFAERLTEDLQRISKDKHLRVRFSLQPIPQRIQRDEPTAAKREQNQWFTKRINYGFERVERLNGNIGYIDLRGFSDHEAGAETVAAAMGFLANAESLIFDLRQNGGGNPHMIALISSYLFGDKPVHLDDLYWRKENRTESFWTKPDLAKVKFTNKDIYVLTSNRTFSAAEEFTYNLKNLKRATIIGEQTGGGAHPGGMVRLHEHFGVFIPFGRAINPISKSNWEGAGVDPDIKVPKEQALKTAYLLALNRSLMNIKDEQVKNGVRSLIEQTQKELDEIKSAAKTK